MNKALASAALTWLLIGLCGGCSLPTVPRGAAPPCTKDTLAQCEAALWDLLDQPERAGLDGMLRRYLARRADGWSRLYQTLGQHREGLRPGMDLLLIDPEQAKQAPPPLPEIAGVERSLILPQLPAPAQLPMENLLLVLAEAASYQHLIWIRRDGTRWHLYAQDPLRPFTAGLPAVMIESASPAHVSQDAALERQLRQTLAAAAEGEYVEAAAGADRLLERLDPHAHCQTGLRARYAIHLLGQAGLLLAPQPAGLQLPPARPAGDDGKDRARGQPTTAYTELLRVYTSSQPSHEWAVRREQIEPALGPQRRAGLARVLGPGGACDSAAPVVTGIGDLPFASAVTSALASPSTLPTRAELAVSQWLPRYRMLVRLVAATQTGWYFAPILAQKRGLAQGLDPAQEPTYRQVTGLVQRHLLQLRALQQSAPQRFEATAVAGLMLWPELVNDEVVGSTLFALLDAAVAGKLAPGSDAPTIFEGLLSGGLTVLGLPEAARTTSLQALHQTLAERLHGDLRKQSGWLVAALYAVDEGYRQLTAMPSEIAENGDQILRALRDPQVSYPELSLLAQAATLYATLAGTGNLDAELIGEPARFEMTRAEAYEALQQAVATLTPGGSVPPRPVVAEVAMWVDGFLALLPLSMRQLMATAQPPSPPSRTAEEAGCQKPPARLSPEQKRAYVRLAAMRQRLFKQAWYQSAGAANPWAPRLRVLVLLLSDCLDLAQRGTGGADFTIATPAAQSLIRDALRSGLVGAPLALAEPAAELYGLIRGFLGPQGAASLVTAAPSLAALRALLAMARTKDPSSASSAPASDSLLALLESVDPTQLRATNDLPALLSELAGELYKQDQKEAGDGMLLLGLLADLAAHKPASDALVEAATRHRSPLLSVLQLYQTSFVYRADRPLAPTAYRDGLRELAKESCQQGYAEQTLDILQALADYTRGDGDRGPARARLRQDLERAEREGLVVPRLSYQYSEQVGTRQVQMDLDLSLGGGLALAGETSQLGLGVSSLNYSARALRRTLRPVATADSDERAMRFYIHAAALYTVYSLLDGDAAAARWSGVRVVTALEHQLLLGRRGAGRKEAGLSWDARAALPLAAQLLAEAGQPLLAAELWKEVASLLSYYATEGLDSELFRREQPAMLGIAGVAALAPVIERTRTSLQRLSPSCLHPPLRRAVARRELSCTEYSVELSLRQVRNEAGAMVLRTDEAPRCPTLAAFQPHAEVDLLEVLREEGQPVEAVEAILHQLVKFPHRALIAARELGRSPDLPPWLRSGMLAGPVLFPALRSLQPEPEDLAALLQETARVPGLEWHGRVLRQLVDYAAEEKTLEPLRQQVEAADFVTRWLSEPEQGGPGEEAATALLLQHAVAAETGRAVDLAATQGPFNVLCARLGTPAVSNQTLRGSLCAAAHRLRSTPPASQTEGQERAYEVYRLLAKLTADMKR